MRLLLRFCASCAFLRPSLLVLFAAFAGHLAAQPANVQADPTTGALFRPAAATFISGNSLLTTSAAAAAYQPLDADLTSWAAVVRAGGFDTFTATPSSANLATLVTGETGSGALVFGTSPTFTTPTLGAATATSITASASTNLTLSSGLVGTNKVNIPDTLSASSSTVGALTIGNGTAATNVAIGAGNINAGGTGTFGANTLIASTGVRVTNGGAYRKDFTVAGTAAVPVVEATVIDNTTSGGLYIANAFSSNSSSWPVLRYTDAAGTLTTGLSLGPTGAVSIASTSASTGAGFGALQVTGGIFAGAASVFGGSATVSPGASVLSSRGNFYALQLTGTDAVAAAGLMFSSTNTNPVGLLSFAPNTGTLTWAARSAAGNLSGNDLFSIAATGAATFAGAVSTTNGNITLTKTGSDAALTLNGGVASYALATFNPNASTTNNFAILAETGGAVYFQQNNGAATKMTFAAGVNGGVTIATGSAGITSTGTGTSTFAGAVTIAGTVIHTLSATPASASATGTVGTMSWDANYIYICTSTNTWKRVAIATW